MSPPETSVVAVNRTEKDEMHVEYALIGDTWLATAPECGISAHGRSVRDARTRLRHLLRRDLERVPILRESVTLPGALEAEIENVLRMQHDYSSLRKQVAESRIRLGKTMVKLGVPQNIAADRLRITPQRLGIMLTREATSGKVVLTLCRPHEQLPEGE